MHAFQLPSGAGVIKCFEIQGADIEIFTQMFAMTTGAIACFVGMKTTFG